jgi:hypothetical protein
MVVFGDIDQLEVDGEGADQADCFIETQTVEQTFELRFRLCRMISAQLFAQGTDTFFSIKKFFAAEPDERFS